MKTTVHCLLALIWFAERSCSIDPACETTKHIDDWKRSAAYVPKRNDSQICDSFLEAGWYKITSKGGQKIPTTCPVGGFRCCTTNSLWLSNETVAEGDDIFPKVNDEVDRVVCSSSYDGDCCKEKVNIKIRNCGTYFVYHLSPPTTCNTAYCFGDKLPCPVGESSETGFPPGCGKYPKFTVSPKVEVSLNKRNGVGGKYNNLPYTFETVQFKCVVNALPNKYSCNVRWYIDNFPIEPATKKDVPANQLHTALLLQSDWEEAFKPNMNVKCSVQIKEAGFPSPGPEQFSDEFLAGAVVKQKHFSVEEGKTIQIPVEITIPIGCSYPTRIPSWQIDSIRTSKCVLNLLTGVPKYQSNPQSCQGGLSKKSLAFESQKCGIYFNNFDGKKKTMVHVTGGLDGIVNFDDRIASLRLYNDVSRVKTDINENEFWKGMVLPDIMVRVRDKDKKILGKTCSSNNDPHITTFEGQYYSFHAKEGEYILYRHKNLPVEVHAYYRKCNSGALCNCGAAIRSGDSAFVVNFCIVKGHHNNYVTQKMCKGNEIQVKERGNKYTITAISGTVITITLGQVYHFFGISSIVIKASEIDKFNTEGLCGTLNDDTLDDLMPQHGNKPFTPIYNAGINEQFGKSWSVTNNKDSLFNIYTITPAVYRTKQYCTCEKLATTYPFGEPDVKCELKSSLVLCTKQEIKGSVYPAPCKHRNYRTRRRRSIHTGQEVESIILDDDNAPEMFLMDVNDGKESSVDTKWKNGWNDTKARDFCTKHFQAANTFKVCTDNIPTVPSGKFINECVEDIKIAGDTSWLDVSINNFGSECLQEASKIENITNANVTGKGTDDATIFSVIAETACPKNCSGRGICDEGICNCTHGFFGTACEREKHEAPDLLSAGFDGLCDMNIRPCKTYVIPGLHFTDGNLTCKYRHFKIELNETSESGITEFVKGEYSGMFSMRCPAPPTRHRRSVHSTASALGYFISISNDGHNFTTEELKVIIYDSLCFECNATSLSCEEVPSCPKKTPVAEKRSNTAAYVGAAIGGAGFVICLTAAFLLVKKKLLKGRSSVKDSTVNIPNKADGSDLPRKAFAYGVIDQN